MKRPRVFFTMFMFICLQSGLIQSCLRDERQGKGGVADRPTPSLEDEEREEYTPFYWLVLTVNPFRAYMLVYKCVPTNIIIKTRQHFLNMFYSGIYCLTFSLLQLDWTLSRNTRKINSPTNQKGYDNSETTVGKLSARKIQIFQVHYCVIHF